MQVLWFRYLNVNCYLPCFVIEQTVVFPLCIYQQFITKPYLAEAFGHYIYHMKKNCHVYTVESKRKVGYPWESTRGIYQHIQPIYGLYNGFMGQYGVMFWDQLLEYLPKGTHNFPLISKRSSWRSAHLRRGHHL